MAFGCRGRAGVSGAAHLAILAPRAGYMAPLDPGLRPAITAALREHAAASQGIQTSWSVPRQELARRELTRRRTRVCDANSLVRYWAEGDMDAAERTRPVVLREFFSSSQIDALLAAVDAPGVWPRPSTGVDEMPPLCRRHRLAQCCAAAPDPADESGVLPCAELRSIAQHKIFTDRHVVVGAAFHVDCRIPECLERVTDRDVRHAR